MVMIRINGRLGLAFLLMYYYALIISSVKIHGKVYHEFAILREDLFLDILIPHPKPLFWRCGPAQNVI